MSLDKITIGTMVETKEYRQVKSGITLYTEFGKLTKVIDEHDGWISLENDIGWRISMKKVYAGWARVVQYANKLLGENIIFETGSSSSAREYFRDIYRDDPIFPTMDGVPNDAGPNATAKLIAAKLSVIRQNHYLSNAIAEIEAMTEQMQRMSTAERKEADDAIAALDAEWNDWTSNPNRSLLIAGQAINKAKTPKKIDVSFAFRMGIDVSKRKRINIEVVERIGKGNKVRVKLKDFGNTECVVAVKQSTHPSTRNEWGVATVLNGIDGWQKVEEGKYRGIKSHREPIEYFLEKHKDAVWDCL